MDASLGQDTVKHTMETKQKKVVLVEITIFLFLWYFLLVAPYIVHTNMSEVGVGIVEDMRILPIQSLPEDVQDVATFTAESTVLLVKDSISGKKTVVILETSLHSLHEGDVIQIADRILEWYVDWHLYQFFDEKFEVLIVGNVEQVGFIESFIEKLLSSPIGGSIFLLSQIVFFIAPPIFIFYISFSFRKRLYLWSIPAIISLYSLEVLLYSIVAAMHLVTISTLLKYFGFSSVIFIPFTFSFLKYEESEEGQRKIKEFLMRAEELLADLFR